MHVKRQCPVCRQPVRKFVRLFFGHSVPEANIGASQANTSTLQASISAPQPNLSNQSYSGDAKDRTEIPDEQDEQPNSVVVDLISSDPMEDETNEASREIDDGEDVEYPNLSHLQYSDIEPDLNEIEQLEDDLVHALRRVSTLIRDNSMLASSLMKIREDLRRSEAKAAIAEQERAAAASVLNCQDKEIKRLKKELVTGKAWAESLQREIERINGENNALRLKKVGVDIERVLHDLSLDQAISSAREFLKLSPNELGCRIEALIKASRLDNERADDLERHLNIKYVECEQLERKLARFEKESREQVAFVPETSIRVDNADRKGELATLIPKSNSLSIIPPPHSLSSYAAKTRPAVIPSAPPKFGGIQKKSFQVPDGFGGTKKIIQTKFGRIDN